MYSVLTHSGYPPHSAVGSRAYDDLVALASEEFDRHAEAVEIGDVYLIGDWLAIAEARPLTSAVHVRRSDAKRRMV